MIDGKQAKAPLGCAFRLLLVVPLVYPGRDCIEAILARFHPAVSIVPGDALAPRPLQGLETVHPSCDGCCEGGEEREKGRDRAKKKLGIENLCLTT